MNLALASKLNNPELSSFSATAEIKSPSGTGPIDIISGKMNR